MLQYFFEGIKHITDVSGYDHMLFLLALCAPFQIRQWKQIVLMATAFTVGHSITLACAALDVFRFSSELIEILIPITIIITCLSNFISIKHKEERVKIYRYIITAGFGLIHGLGFSTYFRMILDETGSLVNTLVMFNLGVEFGQILIILVILIIGMLIMRTGIKQKSFVAAVSILTLMLSTYLLLGKMSG